MTLILFKFVCCSFCDKKKKKKNTLNVLKISTHCFFVVVFLQNAYKSSCSPKTYVVEVVSEHLNIEMMDNLRQQFYPRMRQAGPDKKISDSHRKGYFCSMCENGLSQMM